jgi:hypothetical protein
MRIFAGTTLGEEMMHLDCDGLNCKQRISHTNSTTVCCRERMRIENSKESIQPRKILKLSVHMEHLPALMCGCRELIL